ncbi:MAG TPA: NTP transferase domain-containing protein [Candidatus Syntrophosphaera sp.]|mgnify:CR=1 FL=1|jgi:bifunctional UDP-N-acetylglucosamine pyrophosphorylase/glucosamine-1-phosphate N-acetyltransferase|nr:NTP transferase domain-containing protein [Candidatus Syntrophosphaera sp.]
MTSLAAIILAAGKGTRMKSERAKVTFPLAGKAMIQRVVDTALQAACDRIYVVVGYQKDSVLACLEEDKRLEFVEQNEQLGTGHAVMMAEPAFDTSARDVLILCGDVPLLTTATLDRIYAEHQSSQACCTVLTAFLDDPGKYGRILRDSEHKVTGIVEFKDATDEQRQIKEWNTGIYCFAAEPLFAALKQISNSNRQGEYYLTDVVSVLHSEGKTVSSVVLENLAEVAGVNSQEQLAELEDLYVASLRRKWLNSGVVIHNPATVHIEDEVEIQPDVEIGQNCVIKGKCLLEKGTFMGPGCYVEDSFLSENCLLEGHNILVNAHIPEGHIVPFGEHVLEEEICDE